MFSDGINGTNAKESVLYGKSHFTLKRPMRQALFIHPHCIWESWGLESSNDWHIRLRIEEGTETGWEHTHGPSPSPETCHSAILRPLCLGMALRGKKSTDVWSSKDASHLQIPVAADCHSLQASCPGSDWCFWSRSFLHLPVSLGHFLPCE